MISHHAYIIAHEISKTPGRKYRDGKYGASARTCKKKVEKHKVYPMTRLAASLYQQILKVLFVSDFNGIGIFIRNVYIVGFW